MRYRVDIEFGEDVSKELIDYFVATLRYRKELIHHGDKLPVADVSVSVVDEEPDFSEEDFLSPGL